MRIVIDQDLDAQGRVMAQHVIHLDNTAGNTVPDPAAPATPIQILVAMQHLNVAAPLRATAGWSVANTNMGEATPTTRWQRLVAAANAAGADPAVKALGLSGV